MSSCMWPLLDFIGDDDGELIPVLISKIIVEGEEEKKPEAEAIVGEE